MAHQDEIDLVLGAFERAHDPVDAIARIAVDAVHARRMEALDEEILVLAAISGSVRCTARRGAHRNPGVTMAPPLGSAVSGGMTARLAAERAAGDPHLRSSAEVIGYDIEASDGGVGHIDDFLFDERSLAIRYAVVDSRRGAALAALRSLRGALMAATPPFAERDAATA